MHAIWDDDLDAVRALVTANPALLHEQALIRKDSNWGPPLTYAANVGRDRIIQYLHALGASDLFSALERAALQGKVNTGRMLHKLLGEPAPTAHALGGPAYTLSVEGTALLLELGAPVKDVAGRRLAPVDVVIQTDSRKPPNKHAILEMYASHGLELPDTPTMALHRGRIDLLERHLHADPVLLSRTFTHREIYPTEMGCLDPIDATVGTPLGGTTLLHMCVDYDELEIARWLLDRGMDVNVRARVGAERVRRLHRALQHGGVAAQLLDELPAGAGPSWRRSRNCCWSGAPIRTCGPRSGSNCTRGTARPPATSTAT